MRLIPIYIMIIYNSGIEWNTVQIERLNTNIIHVFHVLMEEEEWENEADGTWKKDTAQLL